MLPTFIQNFNVFQSNNQENSAVGQSLFAIFSTKIPNSSLVRSIYKKTFRDIFKHVISGVHCFRQEQEFSLYKYSYSYA